MRFHYIMIMQGLILASIGIAFAHTPADGLILFGLGSFFCGIVGAVFCYIERLP